LRLLHRNPRLGALLYPETIARATLIFQLAGHIPAREMKVRR
jgi:hypothetical protein